MAKGKAKSKGKKKGKKAKLSKRKMKAKAVKTKARRASGKKKKAAAAKRRSTAKTFAPEPAPPMVPDTTPEVTTFASDTTQERSMTYESPGPEETSYSEIDETDTEGSSSSSGM